MKRKLLFARNTLSLDINYKIRKLLISIGNKSEALKL